MTRAGEAVNVPAETVIPTATVRVTFPLVTVIVPWCVPTTAEVSATLATIEPGPVPDDVLSINQLVLLRAVQLPFAFTVTA